MKLTVTIAHRTKCPKCCGEGVISFYQHIKAGECFKCGGTGNGPMTYTERPMTDNEVVEALEVAGFPLIFTEVVKPKPDFDDENFDMVKWCAEMFITTPEKAKAYEQTMIGARLLLEAI